MNIMPCQRGYGKPSRTAGLRKIKPRAPYVLYSVRQLRELPELKPAVRVALIGKVLEMLTLGRSQLPLADPFLKVKLRLGKLNQGLG